MIKRTLSARLRASLGAFPAAFLTGPRQSGKTTLARDTFPDYVYLSLEDLDTRQQALDDPRGLLARIAGKPGAILDEVQRAPDLFSYLQGFLDERRSGPVVLTGSQHFLLSEKISQSLAGRVAIFELLPLSLAELAGRTPLTPDRFADGEAVPPAAPRLDRDEILAGGLFPKLHAGPIDKDLWLDSYIRTYVERDVRSLTNVGDIETFTRFLGLCAGRVGQLVNLSSLGSDAGVTHTTARRWLSVLEQSYVVELLRPHHENFGKRLIKAPKLYFVDSGVLCHLLGIRRASELAIHPLRGGVFECFVLSELRKQFAHHGERARIHFWRDSAGNEVDFLADLGDRRVAVEAKAGQTIAGDWFKTLDLYEALAGKVDGVLIYGGDELQTRGRHRVRPWWACS